ncbi:hypothetical protein BDV12DRAFT_165388 [Aspergillus spectabilis]
MISPHTPRGGGGGGGTSSSPRTAVPTRGLLLDGIWRCNCPERPPALRLQTKNHGVNHGRWFYTCQKEPQHRCKFFLWASDAEAREKLVILTNSRTESSSSATPRTPSSKTASVRQSTGLLTPTTGQRDKHTETSRPRKTPARANSTAKARMMTEDSDEFEWDDGIESEVMGKVLDGGKEAAVLRQPDFGLPARKTPRTERVPSPAKRKRSFDEADEESVTMTPGLAMSPPAGSANRTTFVTENTSFLTPTPKRYKNAVSTGVAESPLASSIELAVQVSQILEGHGVAVPKAAQEELKNLFGRHEMKMKGIIRGRDISRIAIKTKDEQISRLNERIAQLEAQRELNRSVMGGSKGK